MGLQIKDSIDNIVGNIEFTKYMLFYLYST